MKHATYSNMGEARAPYRLVYCDANGVFEWTPLEDEFAKAVEAGRHIKAIHCVQGNTVITLN